MSDVSLQLSGNTRRGILKDLTRRILVGLGFRLGKWAVEYAEQDLDDILASMHRFFESCLYMRADQAAAYLASSKRKFDFIDRMLQRNINRSVKNGPPLDFELSYVQKLHFAVQLLQQTRHRLLLLSLLDLDLIEGLDPDLRREVLAINALRHQRILEAHPEWQTEIEQDSAEWLHADLQTVIE